MRWIQVLKLTVIGAIMQVSVEKISDIEIKLTISIPAEEVEAAYANKINSIAKKANIKGFRPGKAPISYVSKIYGQDAREEALKEVMENAIFKSLYEQKLKPVSQTVVKPKKIEAGQPLVFDIEFEVLPEIEKVNFSTEDIEQLKVDITDNDIDYVINQLRKQYAKWNPVERGAEMGDRVVIDYYTVFDGKADEENKAKNVPIELGSKTFIPGFEEALVAAKAGDEKKFTLTLPEDFADKEKAGSPIEFVVTVNQVVEGDIPELNEEFAKQLGVKSGNLDDLKKQIRHSLELERNQVVKNKLKEQVFDRLLKDNTFDIPKSLIEREAKHIHDEIYPRHKEQKEHHHAEEELASFNEVAKKRVAVSILIAKFAEQNKMKADKDRVMKRIQEVASSYEHPKEVETWLSTGERLANMESQVLEDQVIDKLLEGVQKTEKVMSYAELKGFRI